MGGGGKGSTIVQNCMTSFMDNPFKSNKIERERERVRARRREREINRMSCVKDFNNFLRRQFIILGKHKKNFINDAKKSSLI